jgi:hypothetical protein
MVRDARMTFTPIFFKTQKNREYSPYLEEFGCYRCLLVKPGARFFHKDRRLPLTQRICVYCRVKEENWSYLCICEGSLASDIFSEFSWCFTCRKNWEKLTNSGAPCSGLISLALSVTIFGVSCSGKHYKVPNSNSPCEII